MIAHPGEEDAAPQEQQLVQLDARRAPHHLHVRVAEVFLRCEGLKLQPGIAQTRVLTAAILLR